MVCGGFYLKFPCPMDAERAAEAVRDISDVTLQAMKNETGIHSNWSYFLIRDNNVLYVDGETPMYAGEYAARETDTGANLYQKICMAIAQRWPEVSFKGKCCFEDTVSGAEHLACTNGLSACSRETKARATASNEMLHALQKMQLLVLEEA